MIDFIMVSYKNTEYVKLALESMERFTKTPHRVTLIENGTDLDRYKEIYKDKDNYQILKGPQNGVWKKPGDGGFDWHQDYGYWYHNACLYPDMASCFIMLDKANKENGCLKILKGSHRVGRISHERSDTPEQTADNERIRELEKRHESVYIEAEPGDALFFHANLLHSSDANKSQNSRRTLIVCFNTKSNNPYKEIGHASYNQLKVANHNSIMEYKID